MSIGSNIKRLREMHGMNQAELAEIAGVTDKAVSTWEHDKKIPRMGAIQKIADYFKITKSDIIEETVFEVPVFTKHPDMLPIIRHRVPVLGSAACGEPIEKPGDGEEYIDINDDLPCDFALIAQGDSMTVDRIYDGDVVFFRAQDDVDDGQIAAIELDGGMTIKRVKRLRAADGSILFTQLISSNTAYPSIDIGGADETRTARICGKAVAFKSLLNK